MADQTPTSPPSDTGDKNTAIIVAVVAISSGLLLGGIAIYFYRKWRKRVQREQKLSRARLIKKNESKQTSIIPSTVLSIEDNSTFYTTMTTVVDYQQRKLYVR